MNCDSKQFTAVAVCRLFRASVQAKYSYHSRFEAPRRTCDRFIHGESSEYSLKMSNLE